MAVKVGSFAKSTSTSTPVSQAVTSVGFKPRAILFFSVGQTSAGSFGANYLSCVGFAARNAADTITAGCTSTASQDAQATSNASEVLTAKAISFVQWGESLLASADLASFDDDGFTLSWTTNNNVGYIIHYMAFGGPDLTDAVVKNFASGTVVGNLSVTGVGFQPDCVLCSSNVAGGVGTLVGVGAQMLGIMVGSGVGHLFSSIIVRDNQDTTSAFSANGGNSGYTTFRTLYSSNGADRTLGEPVSLDADGFTIHWTAANEASEFYALCLKGGSYKVGIATKSITAAPTTQTLTPGFAPEGVLFGTNANTSGGTSDGARFDMGASDGTNHHAIALTDQHNVGTSVAKSISKTDKAFVCVGNDSSSVDAEGTVTLASDITLNWSTNNASAYYFAYFAFAGGTEDIEPTLALWSGIPALLPGRQVYGSGRGW